MNIWNKLFSEVEKLYNRKGLTKLRNLIRTLKELDDQKLIVGSIWLLFTIIRALPIALLFLFVYSINKSNLISVVLLCATIYSTPLLEKAKWYRLNKLLYTTKKIVTIIWGVCFLLFWAYCLYEFDILPTIYGCYLDMIRPFLDFHSWGFFTRLMAIGNILWLSFGFAWLFFWMCRSFCMFIWSLATIPFAIVNSQWQEFKQPKEDYSEDHNYCGGV